MLLGFACPSVQLASNLTPSRRNQDFQEVVDTIEQSFLKAMNFDFAKILVSVCFLLFSFWSRFTYNVYFSKPSLMSHILVECPVGILCFAIKYLNHRIINVFIT